MLRARINNVPTSTFAVVTWLEDFVDSLGMKILQGPFSSYVDKIGNKGLTAIVMIETSHIAFHVWDEQDPALLQLDVYTCGSLDVEKTMKTLDDFFDFYSYEFIVYDRENDFKMIQKGSSL